MHSVLITGAGSGIGAGLATELARAGEHVILTDVGPESVQALAGRLRSAGWSAESAVVDVTSDASVEAALGGLSRRPEVLINNAGLQQVSRLEEFPTARWDFLIQVMLTGVARMTRAVLPLMRERGFGRIINMGSIHSL